MTNREASRLYVSLRMKSDLFEAVWVKLIRVQHRGRAVQITTEKMEVFVRRWVGVAWRRRHSCVGGHVSLQEEGVCVREGMFLLEAEAFVRR
jgi:hypothetical protein